MGWMYLYEVTIALYLSKKRRKKEATCVWSVYNVLLVLIYDN